MKHLRKLISLCLCLILALSCTTVAFAAEVEDATVHTDAPCSLTIWKYDMSNAMKDGVWDEDSFVSTGWRESYVEEVLGDAIRQGDSNGSADNTLGNGQNSNGYALKGVEFTVLRVADIVTFTESANDSHPDYNLTQVLYGFDKKAAAPLLSAIGLADGAGRYTNADATDKLDRSKYYYLSDTLNNALASALAENSTTVKDALESYVTASNAAIVMDKTDENGKTIRRNLTVGLYLVAETAVQEMITSTTNPFLISLPMTTVSGDANSASPQGGHFWNYDVVVYPKNETGIPTLEKTVREAKADTGKNNGSATVTDGFSHNATVNSDDSLVYGQNGNCNDIVLTWRRTSSDYFDTLIDDSHVYSFGIDITKLFSNLDAETATEQDLYKHVKFRIWNATDGYWLTATRDNDAGIYYVTGHVTEEADATVFYPVTMGDQLGQVMVKGCEDDAYIITEVETANGYTLLKDDIHVEIIVADDATRPCDIYSRDTLGVLQNDPHYAFDGGFDLKLANIPQKQLAHNFLTASATVDTNGVTMLEDNGSANAEAPLTVVNTEGFDLPLTGDHGTWMYSATGILLMSGAILLILLTARKKKETQQ